VTAQTPVYGLKYLEVGQPARDTRDVLEDNARSIEAALIRGGIAPTSIQTLTAAGWFSDTGWLTLTAAAGRTAFTGADRPQARMRGGIVYLRGAFQTTGMAAATTYDLCTLPATITRPGAQINMYAGSSTAAAGGKLMVKTDGTVQVLTGPTVGTYYVINTTYCP
jgi:hypothetical protein